jgi:K+-sensing histidine kinase KdpD
MTASRPRRGRYVPVPPGPERSRLWSAAYGLALGAISIGLQKVLAPFVAPDSYQLLLAAVAIAVMYAGVWAGAAALLLTCLAKWFLFLPAEHTLRLFGAAPLLRFGLFLSLGLLICWLGQKMHASRRQVRLLSGLLPICAWCKRVRDEKDQWQPLEAYIHDHSDADFTHGMCPDCARDLVN